MTVLYGETGGRADGLARLAQLLQRELGWTELPPIERTRWGKPFFPSAPEVHFNISHSAGLLLCGIGRAALGVDLEHVRPRRAGLPRSVCTDAEYSWYRARGSRWEDFYALWTLKESRCKCTGEGLEGAARKLVVPLLSPGESGTLDGLTFRSYGGTDWRAAACTAAQEPLPTAICWPEQRSDIESLFFLM